MEWKQQGEQWNKFTEKKTSSGDCLTKQPRDPNKDLLTCNLQKEDSDEPATTGSSTSATG